jgi:hypothetical protein
MRRRSDDPKDGPSTDSRAPNYLVDLGERREHNAVRRIVENPVIWCRIVGPLGLAAGFTWVVLECQKSRVGSTGDIDILAGRLEWASPEAFDRVLDEERKGKEAWHPSQVDHISAVRLSQMGGIRWPPSVDWLVGIEVKSAFLSPEAKPISLQNIKSRKDSVRKVAHMQEQVNSLIDLGLDRVALLDIVASPPVSGPSGGAWISAAGVAGESRRVMQRVFDERLPKDSLAAHFVLSIGAVEGGDESRRGSCCVEELRASHDNRRLATAPSVRKNRRKLERNLQETLASLPKPTNLRVIFVDCRRCGQIHLEGSTC